ncbi:MAG: hypothetical protein WCH98_00725 [Verrucomicrobiota bacterium]
MKIPPPEIDLADMLQEICPALTALRVILLERRANLPRPGYHMDLEATKATESAEFLSDVPALCGGLAKMLRSYRKAANGDHFSDALALLEKLRADPLLLFAIRGGKLREDLAVDLNLLAAVLEPLNEKEPVIPEGGPDAIQN